MAFQIIRNDITKVKADAIVNTANPEVTIGSGVDRAIYEAAGKDKLMAARAEIGDLEVGNVAITPAFDLNAKYIIHSSGPIWQGGNEDEAEKLRLCYDRALKLAFDKGCKSIAFPLMATGSYGFPKELGIQIAVDAFRDFLESYDMEITLVVFGDKAYKISGTIYGEEICSFIDDSYVEKAIASEYRRSRASRADEKKSDAMLSTAVPSYENSKSLEDTLKEIYTDSFGKHLQQLVNKKGLKNAEVYAAANISKQYFSKLLKDQVKPSKGKVMALALGLRLNRDETEDFMRLAGYALSPISQTDKIVERFIENRDFNVIKVDIVLFDYGLDPL